MKITLPEWSAIPDVGLYLEQVTRFVNAYLPKEKDLELTPTMITNYVKLKIVPKGNRKMYSRAQLGEFLIIAYLKTVISMDQIRIVFSHYAVNEQTEEFYEKFSKGLNGKETKDKVIDSLTSSIVNKLLIDEMIASIPVKKDEK